jgi:hypothetical protein
MNRGSQKSAGNWALFKTQISFLISIGEKCGEFVPLKIAGVSFDCGSEKAKQIAALKKTTISFNCSSQNTTERAVIALKTIIIHLKQFSKKGGEFVAFEMERNLSIPRFERCSELTVLKITGVSFDAGSGNGQEWLLCKRPLFLSKKKLIVLSNSPPFSSPLHSFVVPPDQNELDRGESPASPTV